MLQFFPDYKQIRQIEAAQKEIDFRSIIVDELFSSEIQKSGNSIIRNGHDILNFFLDRFAKVFLVINCSKDDQYEVNTAIEFLENFFKYNPRSRAVQIEFKLDKADNETETSEKINEFIHFLKDFNIGYKMYEKYKDFKIRDYGYSQFNQYVKSLKHVRVEQEGTILKAVYKG